MEDNRQTGIKLLEVKIEKNLKSGTILAITSLPAFREDDRIKNKILSIVKAINDDKITIDNNKVLFDVVMSNKSTMAKLDISFATCQDINLMDIYEGMFSELSWCITDTLLEDFAHFVENEINI